MLYRVVCVYFLVVSALSSCSAYQKVLKSSDVKAKIEFAQKLYAEKKYSKATVLFEQFINSYYGKPQGERLAYMSACCYYYDKDYFLSAYQFEKFCDSYPNSEKYAESFFLMGKSHYLISPKYSVDQKETHEAVTKLQDYINMFPDHDSIQKANAMVLELTKKLEKKAFEIAKQYNTIEDYGAAVRALDNFLSNYPGSAYKEDALFYRLDSNYSVAYHSVHEKRHERTELLRNLYNAFTKTYPDTKYASQLKPITKFLSLNN